ncbi:hypothetical protein LQ327_07775 [Actinomycetospora endophytica]|uniref:Uncharacterized protein n=1 Tax=Actinomycetospora endophytica TaxID=2291215 RepID=A0ABS8P4V1_9PSEU|nr:hypothetical protein [Actinomycetospora endophytica]MCD2193283.1 hypothetical protein [Actinomycetospora endophytica]
MSTVPQAGGAPVDGVPPLLARLLDDAALVSPGPRLEMSDVLESHLDARAGDHGGLLGSLVVPVSRLQEFVAELVKRRPAAPVPITLSVDTGLGGVPKALSLTTSRAALLTTAMVEMPAPHDVDSVWLERVTEFVPDDVVAVVEPRRPDADGSDDWIDGVRRVVGHGCRPKLRCGGDRAGAFPGVTDVSRFLAVLAASGRSFTASIGLQGAARHVDPETGFDHHGWLNLMVAVTRALRSVPEPPAGGPDDGGRGSGSEDDDEGPREIPVVDPSPELVEAVRGALDATDAAALAAEVSAVDEPTATRVRAHLSSFGSTAPADQGAEMARLGLV